jgi:hypothetical protein
MSESKHTPGPWVGFSDDGQLTAIMPAMRSGDVCTFKLPPSEADGRLMIAAPELKAFADNISFERRSTNGMDRVWFIVGGITIIGIDAETPEAKAMLITEERRRAAIAKAIGRAP